MEKKKKEIAKQNRRPDGFGIAAYEHCRTDTLENQRQKQLEMAEKFAQGRVRKNRLQFVLNFIKDLYFCEPVQTMSAHFLVMFLSGRPFGAREAQQVAGVATGDHFPSGAARPLRAALQDAAPALSEVYAGEVGKSSSAPEESFDVNSAALAVASDDPRKDPTNRALVLLPYGAKSASSSSSSGGFFSTGGGSKRSSPTDSENAYREMGPLQRKKLFQELWDLLCRRGPDKHVNKCGNGTRRRGQTQNV